MRPRDEPCSQSADPLHVLEILGNGIVGGMEIYVSRLCAYLKPPAFRVTAICPFEGPATAALRLLGCHIIIVPITDDPKWSSIQAVATYVRNECVDVLHAHLGNAHALGAIVSALTGVPCVATIHGRNLSLLDLEAHQLAAQMYLTVVCQAAYSQARALGVPIDRLKLIPNGVPPTINAPHPSAVHALIDASASTAVVGFVGRLAPEKGPELFIRMAVRLRVTHPDVRFVVIGDGPLRASLEAQVTQLGMQACLRFAGVRHDVAVLLSSLTLLVMPSYSEGMPLALMEAMAAGVPVVASAVGGIPELVAHSITGLVVPSDNVSALTAAVSQLLEQPDQRVRMSQAARIRAAAWSLDAAAESMLSYLHQVGCRSSPELRRSATPHAL